MEEQRGYPTIIYTSGFARSAAGWLDEATVRAMEDRLANDPHSGAVMPGAHGARKLRLALPDRGKSGSARVIYLYVEIKGRIYCLLTYRKNTQENLTAEQNRALAAIIEALKGEP